MPGLLAFMVQFGGARFHPGRVSLLAPAFVLVLSACFALAALPLLEGVVSRLRLALRVRRRRRQRRRAVATAECRARALMSELCPHGWRAQITLSDADRPERVALDWMELRGEDRRPTVTRRVWAATIAEALDSMVADRRTDETLEEIEQRAVAEGASWPDA